MLPEPESFVGYTCPRCQAWSPDIDKIRWHCMCEGDECENPVHRGYTHCEDHLAEIRAKREADRVAALSPITLDQFDISKCDMFFCDNTDSFSSDIDDLIEECRYREIPDEDIIIQPCPRSTVHTPDLGEYIEERWAGDFTDGGFDGLNLTKGTQQLLTELQTALVDEAPNIYFPSGHRIDLSPILEISDD